MSSPKSNNDISKINALVETFFEAFSVSVQETIRLDILRSLFTPEALIIKNVNTPPEIYNLETFIKPREELLNNGTLKNFKEKELWSDTQIFGNIAQRLCIYQKSGVLSGVPFSNKGMKTLQFIFTGSDWKISSVAWDDERPGLSIPQHYTNQ